jgi:redox-sensitive bicupin YhaK (pirin superfamily)
VKVISGEYNNVVGPCKSKTPAVYFDINLKAADQDNVIDIPIGDDKNGYIFVYEGSITINGKLLEKDCAGRFKPLKNFSMLNVSSKNGGRFLIMAAKPLNEPIVQYGPFVMNTYSEIQKTIKDYQEEKNGFEGAQSWESEIKMLKYKDEI